MISLLSSDANLAFIVHHLQLEDIFVQQSSLEEL